MIIPLATYSATLAAAPNGPGRNFHTLRLMRQMIDEAKCDPRIMSAAHGVIYLQAERDELAEVGALFEYVRDRIRYVRDVHNVETLCYPAMTLQRLIGDCDDQTMLLCALCEASGYPTRLVMAQYQSGDWEHVYCQVFVRGQWMDCDPIERSAYLGWSAPDPTRLYIEH